MARKYINTFYIFESMNKLLLLLFLFIQVLKSNAQQIQPISEGGNRIIDFRVHYTWQTPMQDLASRFGTLHLVGAGVSYKTTKNWLLEAEMGYQFGGDIREQGLLLFLTNSSGYLMNNSGFNASYYVGARGLTTTARIGRMFPLFKSMPNSGIMITAGGGYYMHKINIIVSNNDVSLLSENYKKGYDRLTAGFGLSEFIGYVFHSKNKYFNFYLGVELNQAYTKSLRGYNYDVMQYDNATRHDFTVGYRFGWSFPVYLGGSNDDEFEYK